MSLSKEAADAMKAANEELRKTLAMFGVGGDTAPATGGAKEGEGVTITMADKTSGTTSDGFDFTAPGNTGKGKGGVDPGLVGAGNGGGMTGNQSEPGLLTGGADEACVESGFMMYAKAKELASALGVSVAKAVLAAELMPYVAVNASVIKLINDSKC